jgi:hypothetical protein
MNKILLLFIILFAFSCKKGEEAGCFTPTGDIKKESRSLENFSKITLYDNINVILIPGTENKAEVEAGENLIPGISTKIENGELIITNENTCNYTRTYKVPVNVYITFNSLREVTHYGGGKISNQDTIQQSYFGITQYNGAGDFDFTFDCDSMIALLHTGAGNLNAKGKVNYGYLYAAANSIFNCENLVVQNMHINNKTTGNFYVHALINLLVEVRSNSTVYYKGSPNLSIIRNSTGEVLPF